MGCVSVSPRCPTAFEVGCVACHSCAWWQAQLVSSTLLWGLLAGSESWACGLVDTENLRDGKIFDVWNHVMYWQYNLLSSAKLLHSSRFKSVKKCSLHPSKY
jgi:hypothetical protein